MHAIAHWFGIHVLLLFEIERRRVDAVSLLGLCGAVKEQVAKVAAAACASQFGAPHAVRFVAVLCDGAVLGGSECWPPAARIKLGRRLVEQIVADAAEVRSKF